MNVAPENLLVRQCVRTETFPVSNPSAVARERMLSRWCEPLFFGDWMRVLMIHFALSPSQLQRHVPYPLDCYNGRAFVTLVAFTLENLRLRFGGRCGALLSRPISNHHFLNVRTYVVKNGEQGIHFLAEWLSNWLAVQLGPSTFGLPYRWGEIQYEHNENRGFFSGVVRDRKTRLEFAYQAEALSKNLHPSPPGSRDEWLMERYTAFNAINSRRRFFRVWHSPWPQLHAAVTITDRSLLEQNWRVFADAELVGANYSPGLKNVWMGRPHRC